MDKKESKKETKKVKTEKPIKLEKTKTEKPKESETLIKENVPINKKLVNFSLFEVLVLLIIIALISVLLGFVVKDRLDGTPELHYTRSSKEIQVFIEEYNRILQHYHGEIDKTELITNAIRGML